MDPNQMMIRNFPMWAPPPAPLSDNLAAPPPPQQPQPFLPPPKRGWKRKNPPGSAAGYQPPALGDLQVQNRVKARRWFKNHNNNPGPNRRHFKAAAPRNTTSYIIRAKRDGGIAPLVSPCPVTPAVLPTPRLSPSREGLADMAQAQWGVDGYGSMKGLIRLRSSPQPANLSDDDDGSSSGSDVEEHVEVERRLDHDLSRFEMVYPAAGDAAAGGYLFEDDDDYDQDAHVARLEEENLTLKERLFLMEQEVADMRCRLEALEMRFQQAHSFGGGRENDDRTHVGSQNNTVDNVERVTDTGSENAVVGSEKELSAGKAAMDLEKSCQPNAEKGAVEKSGQSNTEMVFVDSENIVEHNLEKVAVDSEKSGEPNAEKMATYSEHGMIHDLEKAAVDSENSDKGAADMVDVVLEKSGTDDDEQNRLEASTGN